MQRNPEFKIRRSVDIGMLGVMFFLMVAQAQGETAHEWLGITEMALVIVHQVLNRKWYAALFRGKYSAQRAAAAAVNILLFAAFLLTAVSGMAMSTHAVPFLYGMIPAMTARRMHLSASHWWFILMGIHIGFHAAGVTTEDRQRSGRCRKWISGIIAATGLYLFFRNRIPDYLIDKTPFVYPSFYGPVILMFAENAAMFVFWVLAGMQIANLCWRRQKTIK